MGAVLIFILVVAFVVVPATAVYALILLLAGWKAGHLFAYFSPPHSLLLGSAAALIVLAVLLFFTFGKRLVVK